MLQWGGSIFNEDGTKCVLDSPEAIAAIQFMQDLIYKYRVSPSPIDETAATSGGWGSGTLSWFGSKKAAMTFAGRWYLCSLRDYEGPQLGAVETPYHTRRVHVCLGRATLINKNSKNKEAALQFLKYLTSQEYNELINYQADGIAAVKKYNYTDKFNHNPDFPEEDFNHVFLESVKYSVQDPINSPFVDSFIVNKIVTKQLDLVKANQKTAEAAMKTATKEINAEIQETLKRDPSLKKEYEKLVFGIK
ncbi:MAG: extracellular solute-binding protein [Armatimonadota bacterium]